MAKKKIHNANTNGFKQNPQNINRTGANRKTVSKVILELREKGVEAVSSKQIVDLYESLLNCTDKELKEIQDDKEQPFLNKTVAKEMLNGKGIEIIEKMLDRAHGKATLKQDISQKHSGEIKTSEIDLSKLSTSTLELIEKELENQPKNKSE